MFSARGLRTKLLVNKLLSACARAHVKSVLYIIMKIEFDLPKKKQPVFWLFKGFSRIFIRKARVVYTGSKPEGSCLYLANHANKLGPMVYCLYYPEYHVNWGASPMLGKYGERFRYLRDVLYIQKNGSPRWLASFRAFFEAFFSSFIYKGMKFLPTYTDGRLMHTVKKSVDILGENIPIIIFPENSEEGYKDELTSFFPGFVLVAKGYKRRYGKDVPMRPVYYCKKKRIIAVGEECFLSDFEGGKEQVAEAMRLKVNELYRRIISGEFDKPKN